jgi:hypothetical protein
MLRALVIIVLASTTTACFDLGWRPELMVSGLRDLSTFSAFPCGDVDGDGIADIALNSQDPRDPKSPVQPGAWVLSGRDLTPIYSIAPQKDGERLLYATDPKYVADSMRVEAGDVVAFTVNVSQLVDPTFFLVDPHLQARKPEPRAPTHESDTASGQDAETVVQHESNAPTGGSWGELLAGWAEGGLIDPHEYGWQESEPDPQREKSPLFPSSIRISQAHPQLLNIGACGDFDGDGVLDWAGLTTKPRSVVLVSGADLNVLRTIPLESRDFATAVTGTFALGDVDGDGVPDWLVGIHVSQSDDHDAPRTCRLGLIALVSGTDFHVIKSLERENFLAGPARKCPVVCLPESVQP